MRSVFYISDQTGITTEKLGSALLVHFADIEFRKETFPFSNTSAKVNQVLIKARNRYMIDGVKPIIISSMVDEKLRKLLNVDYAISIDFFESFIPKLETELGTKANMLTGTVHSIGNEDKYNHRIDAIHYSLENDDGVSSKHYDEADIIIIGVSRVGKTPTSIYLAVNYGIKVANYPLAEVDLQDDHLPKVLTPYHHKLFGLSIEAERLHRIRTHRMPGRKYAEMDTCISEIKAAERIMHNCGVPFLNSSHKSIEEISVAIVQMVRLSKQF
jgi:regulator of PEP synthase PpsR (kinase-PPPase family)